MSRGQVVKESLPRTATLFARVAETEGAAIDPATGQKANRKWRLVLFRQNWDWG